MPQSLERRTITALISSTSDDCDCMQDFYYVLIERYEFLLRVAIDSRLSLSVLSYFEKLFTSLKSILCCYSYVLYDTWKWHLFNYWFFPDFTDKYEYIDLTYTYMEDLRFVELTKRSSNEQILINSKSSLNHEIFTKSQKYSRAA